MFQLNGVITEVSEPRQGEMKDGKAWASRDFSIKEVGAQYPQTAKLSMFKTGDYVQYAGEKFPAVGSEVTVDFILNLKEGTSKAGKPYSINELKAYKVFVNNAASTPQPQAAQNNFEEEDDSLPF